MAFVSRAEAVLELWSVIVAQLHEPGTRVSRAGLITDCPVQESMEEQKTLQHLPMQGCHWVALLKAAGSVVLSVRHKCRYTTASSFRIFPIAQGHEEGKCYGREWQNNEMQQGSALLGKNRQ